MGLLDLLFGNKNEQLQEFITKGAVIIDVRTPGEFQGGHIQGSKNIPLQSLQGQINAIKKLNKPIIACCAEWNAELKCTSILKSHGIEVVNGGGWSSLAHKLQSISQHYYYNFTTNQATTLIVLVWCKIAYFFLHKKDNCIAYFSNLK